MPVGSGYSVVDRKCINRSRSAVRFYGKRCYRWGAVITDLVQVSVIVVAIPGLAFFTSQALTANEGVAMWSGVGKLLSSSFVPQGMASTAIFNILPFYS